MILFAVALRLCRTVPLAAMAIQTSRHAATLMFDPTLSDREKERAVQKSSLSLFAICCSIVGRGLLAVLLSLVPLVAFDAAGLVRFSSVTRWLTTWQGLAL